MLGIKEFRKLLDIHKEITKKDRIVYIFRRFNLPIPSNLDFDQLEYQFEEDEMKFIDKKNKVTYSLILYPDYEYYSYIKTFSDYQFVKNYEFDQTCFQQIVFFDLPDNKEISLSSVTDGHDNVLRIAKNPKDDEDNVFFERCFSTIKDFNAIETYNKIAPNRDNFEESKMVRTYDNLYYYTVYRHNLENDTSNRASAYLETSFILNNPSTPLIGHKTSKTSLIAKNLSTPFPTLSFRGNFIHEQNSPYGPMLLYDLDIVKTNNNFEIKESTMCGTDISTKEESYTIKALNSGEISIKELEYLKKELITLVSYEYVSYCLDEIDKIINMLKVRAGKRLRDIDILDVKLNLFKDFDHLAFDIYENLSYYDSLMTNHLFSNKKLAPDQVITLKKWLVKIDKTPIIIYNNPHKKRGFYVYKYS